MKPDADKGIKMIPTTDQERKDRNWVRERTNCTPEKLLNDLKEVLVKDVNEFNRWHDKKFLAKPDGDVLRVHHACKTYDGQNDPWLDVDPDYQSDEHRISVRLAPDNTIKVNIGMSDKVTIKHAWNPDTLQCDYLVDDVVRSTAWISQRVLGDFLFGRLVE